MEIDLLRGGAPTVAIPAREHEPEAYRVVVSPASDRRHREVYRVPLERRLPRIAIPLRAGEPRPVLDLQALVDEAYDKGAYRLKLDYAKPATPPLDPAQAEWARDSVASRRATVPKSEA